MKERYEALKKRLAGDCLQEGRVRVRTEIFLLFAPLWRTAAPRSPKKRTTKAGGWNVCLKAVF